MSEKTTFIKLDRNILTWRWFKDHNTFKLFVFLLLTANTTDKEFEDVIIKRGQLATSYPSLAGQTNLTIKQVRVALGHLKRTGEVAVSTTPKFSVVTVKNYDKYQNRAGYGAGKGQGNGRAGAGEGQQYKNIKNIKNNKKETVGVTPPISDEWSSPPKGTPEYEAWRNQ